MIAMNSKISSSDTIHVQMLGGFSITIGEVTIREEDSPSRKAWLLIQYLIAFQKREISASELVSILWRDIELSSPSGSLKSLVFRARKLLEPLPIPASSLLIQQNGTYRWNPSFQTKIDSRQFDQLCSQIFMEKNRKHLPSLCQKAIDLYKGEFLPNSASEPWVIPIHTYYSSLFLKTAHYYMEILMQDENYPQVVALCRQVLSQSPYDEKSHYNLIYALYLNGSQTMAIEHYQAVLDSCYRHPSEFPPLSDSFTSLYKIISSSSHSKADDIDIIAAQLAEKSLHFIEQGAYFCEYAVFTDLCRITMRGISRTGGCAYLCLFSLTVLEQKSLRTQTLKRAMDSLYQAVSTTLRKGDTFSRYSSKQYVLLLPVAEDNSRERALQAVKRIMQSYRNLYPRNDIILEYSLRQLDSNL